MKIHDKIFFKSIIINCIYMAKGVKIDSNIKLNNQWIFGDNIPCYFNIHTKKSFPLYNEIQ